MLKSKHAVEGYKFFPFIAWGLVIFFAIFVYSLAVELRVISENLRQSAMHLELRANELP